MEKEKKVTTPKVENEETQENLKTLSLDESIIRIRVELQNSKLKKTGFNEYAGFYYFNLSDFLPRLNELELKYGVNDRFSIENDYATLQITKNGEGIIYKMPFKIFDTPINKNGQKSMQDIQYLGAMNTYYKRYLYTNAFGITDGEIIDSMDNTDQANKKKDERLASPRQIELINKFYQGDNLTKLLAKYNVSNIEELPLKTATNIIQAVINKKGSK